METRWPASENRDLQKRCCFIGAADDNQPDRLGFLAPGDMMADEVCCAFLCVGLLGSLSAGLQAEGDTQVQGLAAEAGIG